MDFRQKHILVIAYSNNGVPITFWEAYFDKVIVADSIRNRFADEKGDMWLIIYVCQQPKYSFKELKQLFSHRIFE